MTQRVEAGGRRSRAVPPVLATRALVLVAAAGLVASYVLTGQLWQPRADPPNFPLVSSLRWLSYGVPLVLTAVLAAVRPRPGAVLHAAVLGLALAGDQIRLQPEFVSLAILLVAGAWAPRSLFVARWHLIAMWAWAGIHKILSGGWVEGGAGFIADSLHAGSLRPAFAVLVPLAEIGLAVLGLWPRRWNVLRVAGPLFHLGVVLTLVLAGWNSAVWPWNLALAAATPLAFRSPEARAPEPARALTVTAAAVFLVYPLGFYVGLSENYLSHNLYSMNSVDARLCPDEPADPSVPCFADPFSTWDALNVPLPPERRLYVDWFQRICAPGDRLQVDGVFTRLSERETTYVACRRT